MSILLSLLHLRFVLHIFFLFHFSSFSAFHFTFLQASPRSTFQIEVKINMSFLDHTPPIFQSLVRPPSELDVVVARSIVSHLLNLDLLSLSTSQKDAFHVALALLALASKVPQSKVFISKGLTPTSSISLALDRTLISNMPTCQETSYPAVD